MIKTTIYCVRGLWLCGIKGEVASNFGAGYSPHGAYTAYIGKLNKPASPWLTLPLKYTKRPEGYEELRYKEWANAFFKNRSTNTVCNVVL